MAGRSPKGKKKAADETRSLFGDEDAAPASDPNAAPPPGFPESWAKVVGEEFGKPYFTSMMQFVEEEEREHTILPPKDDRFNAFKFTPFDKVRVVILGQDPYPTPGHAHGLCFSVRPGVTLPGSLRNIYREMKDDLGIPPAKHGYLAPWAAQGVFLLNAVLSVRAGSPNSHKNRGWEKFTDAVLHAVGERNKPAVFLLWGSYAQKKEKLIDAGKHTILKGVHPSPLSASNGFFGSKPFSKINAALEANGQPPIDWRLPEKVSEETL